MRERFDVLMDLASRLPTGLKDPKALDKLRREEQELVEALARDDALGALLEAGDVAYYAAKAYGNDQIEYAEARAHVEGAAQRLGIPAGKVLKAAEIKYGLRARPGNPKDDAEERAAVAHWLSTPMKRRRKRKS